MRNQYRSGARFIADPRQHSRPLDRNQIARILALAEALERRTRPQGARNGVVSQPGLRVLRVLLLRFLRKGDGLCTPSYLILAAATGLARSSVANALRRLEACGILRTTRRLVREVIDAGGFPMTVTRQASNLYAVHEPSEAADRLPVRAAVVPVFRHATFAALAGILGWDRPSPRDALKSRQKEKQEARQGRNTEGAATNSRLEAAFDRLARDVASY